MGETNGEWKELNMKMIWKHRFPDLDFNAIVKNIH